MAIHEYDVTLKSILRSLTGKVLKLTGVTVVEWLSVELPEVRSPRVDLLGRCADGRLIHIELQSTNDPRMVWRMADYAYAIERVFDEWPRQLVLYVGLAPLSMPRRIENEAMHFECRMVDIRELDGEPLLASTQLDDNIVAILCRLRDERAAVRQIVARIAETDPCSRAEAMQKLTILAGLRKLGEVVKLEARNMPITESLLDHDLLGPILRRGIEQGMERGIAEGERRTVLRQMGRRFGPLPAWATERIAALSPVQLEQVEIRLLDAASLDELLH